jgi:predicted transposase YbfD/YdcC
VTLSGGPCSGAGEQAATQLGPVIRSYWAIENSLHWVMDMVFGDDECRIRTDQAPANFTTSNPWPTT